MDPIWKLVLGLVTGVVFGFLLQKGQVTRYRVIIGQFLLQDFTMLKVMLTAVVVGGFGFYALVHLGVASMHVKPMILGGVITGGVLFGIGMAILGYCPGTGVAAMADGSRHAIYGVLGMLLGAAVYAEVYPIFSHTLLVMGDFGKVTLVDVTGASPYILMAGIGVVAAVLFGVIEIWERSTVVSGDAKQEVRPRD